jgi:hypothetical protein
MIIIVAMARRCRGHGGEIWMVARRSGGLRGHRSQKTLASRKAPRPAKARRNQGMAGHSIGARPVVE